MPHALAVGGTYLIFSEVSYLYTPTIGYVMAKTGVTLSDVAYTRPRQSTCVIHTTCTATTQLVTTTLIVQTERVEARDTKKGRAVERGLSSFVGNSPAGVSRAATGRNSLSRRRADCRPKTCQSDDPPRSRS